MQRPDTPGEFRTAAQRRGEALRDLAGFVLDNHTGDAGDPGGSRRPGRQHPHVLAVMDLDDLYAAMLAGLGVRTADVLIRQRARALTPAA